MCLKYLKQLCIGIWSTEWNMYFGMQCNLFINYRLLYKGWVYCVNVLKQLQLSNVTWIIKVLSAFSVILNVSWQRWKRNSCSCLVCIRKCGMQCIGPWTTIVSKRAILSARFALAPMTVTFPNNVHLLYTCTLIDITFEKPHAFPTIFHAPDHNFPTSFSRSAVSAS